MSFRRDVVVLLGRKRGVASMEFGILSPVLVVFLLGMVDIATAMVTLRRLNTTVQQIGLMATQSSVQPDQTTNLTVAALDQASSVIYAILPGLVGAATFNAITNPVPSYAVVASDVVFTPTSSSCQAGLTCTSYTANMAWSVPLQYGQQIQRACGTVTQVSATAASVIVGNLPSTVPTKGITSALTSMLIVDVVYNFTPYFGRFLGSITMRQTAYFNERSIASAYVTYNIAGTSSGGVICAGYT